jgi:hypothetical protein
METHAESLTLIGETTEILRKQRRVLKDLAHCLFNRTLSDDPRHRIRRIREFNKFMAGAEKKLAALEAECAVLEKLRGMLSPPAGQQMKRPAPLTGKDLPNAPMPLPDGGL